MHRVRAAIVPAYLFLCLLLGGASAAGAWGNLALQLTGIALIAWSLASKPPAPLPAAARVGLVILLLLALLFALQVLPLPPAIWTHLPGRESITSGFGLLGRPLPWMPVSPEPYRTLASAFWLIPAAAVFVAMVRLGAFRASWMAWVLAAATLTSVLAGALQVAGGEQSDWYFYQVTNFGAMVGFFSNANHLATLMVSTIPFLAALYLNAAARGGSVQKSAGLLVILSGTLLVVFVALGVNLSLAGVGLSVPVLAASLLMLYARRRRIPAWAPAIIALLLVGSTAVVMSAPFNNNLTTAKAGDEDSRRLTYARTFEAAKTFFPAGSGVGTFQQAYRQLEDPAKTDIFYMNHAHSDYLELLLETGVPGLLLLLLFLAWWVRRAVAVWHPDYPDAFARAATIATAAILVHSIVDYPLRTAAIGAVFAMCCGLMAAPRARPAARAASADDDAAKARHLSAD